MQGVDQIRAHEPDHEFSDSENDPNDLIQTTATRHSSRISGKSLKAAVSSSADDAFDLDVKTKSSDGEENEIGGSTISGGKDAIETEVTKVSEQLSEISTSAIKLKEVSHSNHGSLVQATISTLFKKKEEKVSGARQKGKALEERKIATRSTPRKKQPKVSDDEIEDISDPSQDSSDEEWGA
ncbi:hypothetical protein Ccrd_014160 [Cynara cardunculus var. scolymus]|uniref:Uncharacterized protein n=1 Tax=Cynara cardunculus var. scolymus TaxID=59895 RepID=A0A103YE69_CYNCS|nr:hypothetical protein Ccrd_014160 [Cynara cardunculus var. scolymus]